MRAALLFCIIWTARVVGSIEGDRGLSGELLGRGDLHKLHHVEEGADNMDSVEGVPMRRRSQAALGATVVTSTKIGSRPPSCKGKCKGCVPCSPVEVTVPPAQQHRVSFTPFPTGPSTYHLDESPYYSVAWRCRCKGKYYNP